MRPRRAASLALGLWAFGASLGCGAVYPEVTTPINAASPGARMDPPPPEDILYVQFAAAEIPPRTRDGRAWDAVGGAAPDMFAKLVVDKKDVIVTPVESNTLKPTWPDQVRANYRIRSGAQVRVELWDSNPINNHPVCSQKILNLHEEASSGRTLEVDCDSGARLLIQVEPAHAKIGMGLYYELRNDEVYVTRVLAESPAARAGLKSGDEIVQIQGVDVASMEDGRAQSMINANASIGVKLGVRRGAGIETITVKNGPIYPLIEEEVPLDQ